MQNPDFNKWLEDTALVVPNADAPEYFKTRKEDFDALYTKYWARFQQKTPAERLARTLEAQDGR